MSDPILTDGLTYKQLRFAEEYVKDFIGAKAAVRAGYAKRSASQIAYELLRNDRVKDAVGRYAGQRLAKLEDAHITPDQIMTEYSRVCRADLRKVIDEAGNLMPVKHWPNEMAGAIASVKVSLSKTGERTTEIKLWDKIAALTNMAKHYGLLKDLTEHTGTITYGWLDNDPPPDAPEEPTH